MLILNKNEEQIILVLRVIPLDFHLNNLNKENAK